MALPRQGSNLSDKRVIFKPGVSKTARRIEWVELVPALGAKPAEGVYVWGLATCDSLAIIERSTQGGVDEASGISKARQLQLQIMLSCFDGDQPGARRVFTDADVAPINEGSWEAFSKIVIAIAKVNGQSESEADALRDFSPATGALNPSVS